MMLLLLLVMMMMIMMKDILDYLCLFTDTTESLHGDQAVAVHPADMVLEAFKDEETSKLTLSKLESFLQEAHAVHGKQFVAAPWPASFLDFGSTLNFGPMFCPSPFLDHGYGMVWYDDVVCGVIWYEVLSCLMFGCGDLATQDLGTIETDMNGFRKNGNST